MPSHSLNRSTFIDERIFDRPVYALLGIPVDALSTVQTCDRLVDAVRTESPCFFTTPNLNFLVACQTDANFRDSVVDSDLVVADGQPLVRIAKLLDIPITERVAGSTVFERLRRRRYEDPLAVYFFGGPEGIAERASNRLSDEHVGMTGVGAHYPGFGSFDDMLAPTVLSSINAQKVDILVVALGAKKGQAWIQAARHHLDAKVITHLGAVVNFVAGTVKRAPAFLQNSGMEWAWRIYQEPGLFRRYFSDGKTYLSLLFKHVLPLRRYQRKLTRKYHGAGPNTINVRAAADLFCLEVIGFASNELLPNLRTNLKELLSRPPTEVQIDLSQCRYLDAAFLGQVLLLLKVQRSRNQPLLIKNPSPEVKKLFELHAVAYLLQGQALSR